TYNFCFQAEDGIRDFHVTGVQTCALPIYYNIKEKDNVEVHTDNESYIKMYLDTLKLQNYSPLTIKNYKYELDNFSKKIDKSVLKADTSTVRKYLSDSDDLMTSTIVTKMDTISGFYHWLVLEDELLKNPCDKIKRPKLPK